MSAREAFKAVKARCGGRSRLLLTESLQPMPLDVTLDQILRERESLNAFTLFLSLMICRFLKGLLP